MQNKVFGFSSSLHAHRHFFSGASEAVVDISIPMFKVDYQQSYPLGIVFQDSSSSVSSASAADSSLSSSASTPASSIIVPTIDVATICSHCQHQNATNVLVCVQCKHNPTVTPAELQWTLGKRKDKKDILNNLRKLHDAHASHVDKSHYICSNGQQYGVWAMMYAAWSTSSDSTTVS